MKLLKDLIKNIRLRGAVIVLSVFIAAILIINIILFNESEPEISFRSPELAEVVNQRSDEFIQTESYQSSGVVIDSNTEDNESELVEIYLPSSEPELVNLYLSNLAEDLDIDINVLRANSEIILPDHPRTEILPGSGVEFEYDPVY